MNRLVLITGTRKGIGKFLAESYLERGMFVVGCSRRQGSIEHANYHHFELDVSDERAVVLAVKEIVRDKGGIDVLINNAGIAAMNHSLLTPGKTMRTVFETNLFGSFYFLREVGKVMNRRKSGRIVNFSTVASPLNLEGEAVYAASKAGIESLTRTCAKEFGAFNVTVNAVGPTPVETDLIKLVPKEKIQALIERQALNRLGSLEDVRNVVDFFISPASEFITGQIIYLGGVSG